MAITSIPNNQDVSFAWGRGGRQGGMVGVLTYGNPAVEYKYLLNTITPEESAIQIGTKQIPNRHRHKANPVKPTLSV